jgi:hypothetical protein
MSLSSVVLMLPIQGLHGRWVEFVKLLERTGPQTRIRIELLTAATQEKEVCTSVVSFRVDRRSLCGVLMPGQNFGLVAADFDRVLQEAAMAVERSRSATDLHDASVRPHASVCEPCLSCCFVLASTPLYLLSLSYHHSVSLCCGLVLTARAA